MPVKQADQILKPHRRQYILGPEQHLVDVEWQTIELGPVVLSFCPELRAQAVQDLDGLTWVLLGLAAQTNPNGKSPAEQIETTPTADVPELRYDWAGRWLLVAKHRVQPDAGSQIGVLVGQDISDRNWMSSSPALLQELCGNDWQPLTPSYQTGAEFFPVPACSLVGATRLMPSQWVDPRNGRIHACQLLPDVPTRRPDDEILDELAARLKTGFQNVPHTDDPFWFGLSAGGDSRLMLAAAAASGREISTFTWIASRTKLCDRVLPPKLAECVGMSHTYVRAGPIVRSREQLAEEHAGKCLSRGNIVPLLRGARLGLTGLCTGGQCFDACKSSKFGKFPDDISDSTRAGNLMAKFYLERPGSFYAKQYALWLDHVKATDQEGLDYRNRWPIEQSAAAWQAGKEQLYDIQQLERFSIANCGAIQSLSLGIDFERAVSRQYELDLIDRLAPKLASFPRNPSDADLIGPLRAIARRFSTPTESLRSMRIRVTRRYRGLLAGLGHPR